MASQHSPVYFLCSIRCYFLVFLFLVSVASVAGARTKTKRLKSESRFGCLNGKGEFVDWWFIYKQSDGASYVYLDGTMTEPLPVSEKKAMLLSI